MTKKCGIALDTWKLKIFEARLKKEGYTWKRKGNLTPDTLLLQVKVEESDLQRFANIVREMEATAQEFRHGDSGSCH